MQPANTPEPVTLPADIQSGEKSKARRFSLLLDLEASARSATSKADLALSLANDPRQLVAYEQAFVFRHQSGRKPQCIAINGQPTVDRFAPVVQMVEAIAKVICLEKNPETASSFRLESVESGWKAEQDAYPFRHWVWLPIRPPNAPETDFPAGLILTRSRPFEAADLIILSRITEAYGHAWVALRRKPAKRLIRPGLAFLTLILFLFALLLIPVPYTFVAPAQIVAADPFNVTVPIDGVIDEVLVNPNDPVENGMPLARFVDTTLASEAEIAREELSVAQAKSQNINRSAIIDPAERRELTIAQAEADLARVRFDYATRQLSEVEIKAPASGIVLFKSKTELTGQPVSTGQKIMEIADPARVEVRIEVSPENALALETGARANLFLDTAPLKTIPLQIDRTNFTPEILPGERIAYTAFASLRDTDHAANARIGLRGTAKITSGRTRLGLWLFKRPIATIRRRLGL